jgi:hypothetical protein
MRKKVKNMGYYEERRKIAKELDEKLSVARPRWSKEQIDMLEAQMVGKQGIPKKAAREIINAQIKLGNITVVE